MPSDSALWFRRIKDVEREYGAARFSVIHALEAVRADPTLLKGDLRVREIECCSRLLEGTYLIRLFAEFESGLRSFQRSLRRRRPPASTERLLNSVAATCKIPHERPENAHLVRDYRNALVHERHQEAEPVDIAAARGYLCVFFSFLPQRW